MKILPFDVLVLFLKCAQFLISCIQFLMDTILNLAIVQFFNEEKGRCAHATCVSYLRRRETCPQNGCLASEEKGDTPTQ
jgi:hypothetical protein